VAALSSREAVIKQKSPEPRARSCSAIVNFTRSFRRERIPMGIDKDYRAVSDAAIPLNVRRRHRRRHRCRKELTCARHKTQNVAAIMARCRALRGKRAISMRDNR